MNIHAPPPPHWTPDADRAICGARLSVPKRGHAQRLADRPCDVDCDACIMRVTRYGQDYGLDPAEVIAEGAPWPWDTRRLLDAGAVTKVVTDVLDMAKNDKAGFQRVVDTYVDDINRRRDG